MDGEKQDQPDCLPLLSREIKRTAEVEPASKAGTSADPEVYRDWHSHPVDRIQSKITKTAVCKRVNTYELFSRSGAKQLVKGD